MVPNYQSQSQINIINLHTIGTRKSLEWAMGLIPSVSFLDGSRLTPHVSHTF